MDHVKNFGMKAILEDIRSAFNVGSIFRTSDAAGLDELILSGITPFPPHNRIPKTALGAIETVKWKHFPKHTESLKYVKDFGKLVAIELTDDAQSLYEFEFPEKVTIVLGNEITGVSEEMLEIADHTVQIPMFGHKESLNVANTFSIVVYEIVRQRLLKSH